MNYFKNYLRTHCKYWWVYILSIFSSLFGIFIVAISFIRIFDAIVIKPIINHLITFLLFYAIMYFCFYWLIIDFRM